MGMLIPEKSVFLYASAKSLWITVFTVSSCGSEASCGISSNGVVNSGCRPKIRLCIISANPFCAYLDLRLWLSSTTTGARFFLGFFVGLREVIVD